MKVTAITLAGALALTGTLAYAQTNPGGGVRASGYPTAGKNVNETSDPLIRKPTSTEIRKGRPAGVTVGRARSGTRQPVTGAPTSSQ